jgi:thioredoxin reductase
MFTRDELRALPLFSDLVDKGLDHLTRTSPDVRLLPGKYVVHEGDAQRVLLESTVPGILAVGDVRAGSVKRVAAGVGEGSMVIAFVHQFLASGSVGR